MEVAGTKFAAGLTAEQVYLSQRAWSLLVDVCVQRAAEALFFSSVFMRMLNGREEVTVATQSKGISPRSDEGVQCFPMIEDLTDDVKFIDGPDTNVRVSSAIKISMAARSKDEGESDDDDDEDDDNEEDFGEGEDDGGEDVSSEDGGEENNGVDDTEGAGGDEDDEDEDEDDEEDEANDNNENNGSDDDEDDEEDEEEVVEEEDNHGEVGKVEGEDKDEKEDEDEEEDEEDEESLHPPKKRKK